MKSASAFRCAVFGPVAAITLALLLVPLRGFTPASNFTFAFMALTIVVAELNGAVPALATSVVSTLSLDVLLTRPYLQLAMEDKHDVIALVGFSVCGLLAAGLASQRNSRLRRLEDAQEIRSDEATRLEATVRHQEVRRTRLAWLEATVTASLPVWLDAWTPLPGLLSWLALVAEGFCLAMAAGMTLVELHFEGLAAGGPVGVRVNAAWTRWDDVRSALWYGLALACLVPWSYGVFDGTLPPSLLAAVAAVAVSLLALITIAETAAVSGPHTAARGR